MYDLISIYNLISDKILKFLENNDVIYDVNSETRNINNVKNKENEKCFLRFKALLKYIDRTLDRVPKEVIFSKHLKNKFNNYLSQELIDCINFFKSKFENGEEINFNLSRKVFDDCFEDWIFNIWNIRHLHLNDKIINDCENMKNNRSDYLLFFIINKLKCYFIDVIKHPRGYNFTSTDFLKILDEENWISIIGLTEIDGIPVCEDELGNLNECRLENNQDIYALTKNGINTPIYINGKYFFQNGINSFGEKEKYIRTTNLILNTIVKLNKNYIQNLVSVDLEISNSNILIIFKHDFYKKTVLSITKNLDVFVILERYNGLEILNL